MQTIDFLGGEHIASAAAKLVEAAKAHGAAKGKFNDIELIAKPDSSPDDLVAYFERECAARSEAYRNSPEGKEAAKASNDCRASLQAKHDALMDCLPALDWKNDVAVLDWICAMQEPSDHVGVISRRETIVSAFERHGFKAGANCGKNYRDGDRENTFSYLVGQALSGLKEGPAIHSIIHKFASEWHTRFGITPPKSE